MQDRTAASNSHTILEKSLNTTAIGFWEIFASVDLI
jgi:hypothetical protein